MLSVTDTTAKQTFASSNAINLIPKVYAEWNYNAFTSPSVTASTSTVEAVSNATINSGLDLTAAAAWSGTNSVTFATGTGLGKANAVRASNNCAKFTMPSFGSQISTANKIKVSATAKTGFYKMVFDVKSTGFQTFGIPGTPTSVAVDASTGSGVYTYYYRIVPIGSNGQTAGLDLSATPADEYVFTGVPNTTIVFKFNTSSNAAAYQIYRSTFSGDTNPVYLTTVGNYASTIFVTDVIANTPINNYAPSNFTNEVYLSPQIVFYNNTTVVAGSTSTKFFKTTNSDTFKPEGTIIVDPIDWQRVEVWFGVKSDNSSQAFDRVNLLLNASADYTNSSFYVDNIRVYEVTEYDFFYNQYFPTDSVFMAGRPGETLLNLNIPSNSPLRSINNSKWNKATKPCHFGIQNPMLILNNNYPYRQYVPSIYDKFKYYLSQPGLTTTGIQAQYDSYLSVNKIVIKILKGYAYPATATVTLTTSTTPTVISGVTFGSDGIATLYYSGSAWSQTAWSSPPVLTADGHLQATLNNVKAIALDITSLTINPSFSANGSLDSSTYSNELSSLSLIEISPRLEIDVSPLLMNIAISKEIAKAGNGFPIGLISSNSASLNISNIPVYYGGSPFTIFDNTSTEATFYNLMRQGVKFTCSYTSPLGTFTGSIPAGVFYSDTWTINDIDTVSVTTFDQAKYLMMSMAAPQYSANNASLLEIITDLFNISGFSDYDYDSLVSVIDQKTKISYFWCDEQNSLFDVLQNLFVAHQLGAYFDEYGMMQFISLSSILNKYTSSAFTPDFLVTDAATTVNTIAYKPNILPGSFNEEVGSKVGKVVINYKTANTAYSDNVGDMNGQMGLIANKVDTVRTIWQEETETGLACSQISRSMLPQDNYFYFDPSLILDSQRTIASNFGDAFIGSEAVSYEGLEYSFFPTNMSDINIKKIITAPGDIDKAIEEIKQYLSLLNINFKSINYYPTGKAVGVKRGKFNTPISNHLIFDSQAGTANAISGTTSPSSYFNYYSMTAAGALTTSTSGVKFSYGNAKISNTVANTAIALSPNATSANYNYYAFSFHSSSRHADQSNIGMYFNHTGTGSTAWFLTLSRVPGTKSTKVVLGYGGPNNNAQNVQTSGVAVVNQILSADVYDGAEHRVSIAIESPYVYVYLDGRQILKLAITANLANIVPNYTTNFGVFVQSTAAVGIATATFTEIYACDFPQVSYMKKKSQFKFFPRYHFQSEVYLSNIVHNIPNSVAHYLWQSKPQIRGVKFYDVKHSLSPAIPNTAGLQKVFYGQANSANSGTSVIMERTNAWDVSYSPIAITPFRSRFIAVNNSNQLVYLKAPGDKLGDISVVPLQVQANYQFLSESKIVERVIDKKYSNTSVELNTDWVQGDSDAYRILADATRLLNGFHRDITIQVFGNPLIQLGDFCQFKYSLKRIGTTTPVYYFVEAINQSFEGGLTTSLTLRPMILS